MIDIEAKALEFLTKHPVGVLSTVSSQGEPWGAAINFVVDEQFNFYFMTRAQTLKFKNITESPHVALTVVDSDAQITVQASGSVASVAAEDLMDIVFQKLDKVTHTGKSHWIAPVYKVHQGDYAVMHFTPTSLQYADFSQIESDMHSSPIIKLV
jgi:uncharacterized pyridoxamine 5'-phosphate oxidase family protein